MLSESKQHGSRQHMMYIPLTICRLACRWIHMRDPWPRAEMKLSTSSCSYKSTLQLTPLKAHTGYTVLHWTTNSHVVDVLLRSALVHTII